MRAYIHRGMVVFSEKGYHGAPLKRLYQALNTSVRWHRKWYGESLSEAKRSAQVSVNHEHMPSRHAAQELVNKATEAMRRDYPKLARYLVADWRQGHKREKGNVVLLSFWLNAPSLEYHRATDRMMKANLTPEQWKGILRARRQRRRNAAT